MNVIVKDPEILGGIPVFAGTRVPVKNLFDALIGGDSIPEFLDDFPTVTFEQVREALEDAGFSSTPACCAQLRRQRPPHESRSCEAD